MKRFIRSMPSAASLLNIIWSNTNAPLLRGICFVKDEEIFAIICRVVQSTNISLTKMVWPELGSGQNLFIVALAVVVLIKFGYGIRRIFYAEFAVDFMFMIFDGLDGIL